MSRYHGLSLSLGETGARREKATSSLPVLALYPPLSSYHHSPSGFGGDSEKHLSQERGSSREARGRGGGRGQGGAIVGGPRPLRRPGPAPQLTASEELGAELRDPI